MFFSQCAEAMSQFLREFWCLDVSCPGPSRLSCSAGPIRSELRCLAAGQPSRPISVEAPLWSQVVGSAYREDQQRSVSLLRSLSPSPPHLLPLSLSFLFSALSPFGIIPPPPSVFFFSNHHISIYILSLSSLLPSTFPQCCVSCWIQTAWKCFFFQTTPHIGKKKKPRGQRRSKDKTTLLRFWCNLTWAVSACNVRCNLHGLLWCVKEGSVTSSDAYEGGYSRQQTVFPNIYRIVSLLSWQLLNCFLAQ